MKVKIGQNENGIICSNVHCSSVHGFKSEQRNACSEQQKSTRENNIERFLASSFCCSFLLLFCYSTNVKSDE